MKQRKSLTFKVPNITDKMWIYILIMGIQEKLNVKKCPEEEMCLHESNQKCLQKRDHLLSQLSMELYM